MPCVPTQLRLVPQADVSLLKKVANLLDQFEFDVVDTGPLGEGRRFQKDSPRMACPSNPRSCERRALPPIT
jgi:hypothetical protein